MLHDLGKIIQDIVTHELDTITESEWFADLVKDKVAEILKEREVK
jgi:hypothetical protein